MLIKEEYLAVEWMCELNSNENIANIWPPYVGKLQIQQEVETAFSSLCLVSFSDDSPLGVEECNSCYGEKSSRK